MKNKSSFGIACATLSVAATLAVTTVSQAGEIRTDVPVSSELKNLPGALMVHGNQRIRVNCDNGEHLGRALRRARAGDMLRISGICVESVVITTDRLHLIGDDGATIDGSGAPSEAVVMIDGARGVTLENLVVRNGADQGVLGMRQAQGFLKNLDVRNNGTVGFAADRSHFDVENLTLVNNGSSGMDAFTASTIVMKGAINASNNGGDGLVGNGKTFIELRGAIVTASNNLGSGVSVINDSRLQIFSFPEAQGSSIIADGNGFAGIGILGAELGVVGSEFFGSGANVIRATNNIFGFFMPAGAILSPHATAQFVAENNNVGILMEDGASALIVGGLRISNNGAGIAASGAGTLTLVSVPPNPSFVTNNAFDMDLGFGTRATLDEVQVGSLACDDTVLVRGSVQCNTSPAQ